jgi:hypothetical protein
MRSSMSGFDASKPMGGQTSLGPSRNDFTSVEAFRDAQRAFFEGTTPAYAACGCCGAYHPVPYLGDCRADLYRIDDPDELHGAGNWIEVE